MNVLLPVVLALGMAGTPDPAAAGRRIDIELQDAEIHAVLDLFADIGKVNIVAAKGIEGRVTAKFHDTPWDTVLAHILVSCNLRMRREGNVIYVVKARDRDRGRSGSASRGAGRRGSTTPGLRRSGAERS